MGSDHSDNCNNTIIAVSIHAPAWGATFIDYRIVDYYACFNPRSRMGSDHIEYS